MTSHQSAHFRNLIDIHRRMQDPLVTIPVDDLEKMLIVWELYQIAKPRFRVPSRQLADEEFRE